MAEPSDDYLTKEEQAKVFAWLKEKRVEKCPVCDSGEELEVNATLAAIPTTSTSGRISLANIFPCVVVYCPGCGHMQFFSAMSIGLMVEKKEGENGK